MNRVHILSQFLDETDHFGRSESFVLNRKRNVDPFCQVSMRSESKMQSGSGRTILIGWGKEMRQLPRFQKS
jgi:hypothetical protein